MSLAITALVSIVLGFLKIYLHYNSVFRVGPLDYVVGVGAIFGGFMVFTGRKTIVVFTVCTAFLALELLKVTVDFFDFGDVFLCILAIICLLIPIVRYVKINKNRKSRVNKLTWRLAQNMYC